MLSNLETADEKNSEDWLTREKAGFIWQSEKFFFNSINSKLARMYLDFLLIILCMELSKLLVNLNSLQIARACMRFYADNYVIMHFTICIDQQGLVE